MWASGVVVMILRMRSYCYRCGSGLVFGRVVAGAGCLVCARADTDDGASDDAVSLVEDADIGLRASVSPSAVTERAGAGEPSSGPVGVGRRAEGVIVSSLAGGGWAAVSAVEAAASAASVNRRALQRAARRLQVERRRLKSFPPVMEWRLEPLVEEGDTEPTGDGAPDAASVPVLRAEGPTQHGTPPSTWSGERAEGWERLRF
jgi:hypothetical protein